MAMVAEGTNHGVHFVLNSRRFHDLSMKNFYLFGTTESPDWEKSDAEVPR